MSTTASLDRIGVGIDTARYGHRVSFLRPDRKPAAQPLTVMSEIRPTTTHEQNHQFKAGPGISLTMTLSCSELHGMIP